MSSIGIIVGSVVGGLVLVLLVIYFIYKKTKNRKEIIKDENVTKIDLKEANIHDKVDKIDHKNFNNLVNNKDSDVIRNKERIGSDKFRKNEYNFVNMPNANGNINNNPDSNGVLSNKNDDDSQGVGNEDDSHRNLKEEKEDIIFTKKNKNTNLNGNDGISEKSKNTFSKVFPLMSCYDALSSGVLNTEQTKSNKTKTKSHLSKLQIMKKYNTEQIKEDDDIRDNNKNNSEAQNIEDNVCNSNEIDNISLKDKDNIFENDSPALQKRNISLLNRFNKIEEFTAKPEVQPNYEKLDSTIKLNLHHAYLLKKYKDGLSNINNINPQQIRTDREEEYLTNNFIDQNIKIMLQNKIEKIENTINSDVVNSNKEINKNKDEIFNYEIRYSEQNEDESLEIENKILKKEKEKIEDDNKKYTDNMYNSNNNENNDNNLINTSTLRINQTNFLLNDKKKKKVFKMNKNFIINKQKKNEDISNNADNTHNNYDKDYFNQRTIDLTNKDKGSGENWKDILEKAKIKYKNEEVTSKKSNKKANTRELNDFMIKNILVNNNINVPEDDEEDYEYKEENIQDNGNIQSIKTINCESPENNKFSPTRKSLYNYSIKSCFKDINQMKKIIKIEEIKEYENNTIMTDKAREIKERENSILGDIVSKDNNTSENDEITDIDDQDEDF